MRDGIHLVIKWMLIAHTFMLNYAYRSWINDNKFSRYVVDLCCISLKTM